MTKMDAVLFDYDGTIMDTNDIIMQSWAHIYRVFKHTEPDETAVLNTFGETIDQCIPKLFPEFNYEDVLKEYRGYQYDHYEDVIKLFPGTIETMESLYKAGVKMGVVTNRYRNSTEIGLKKFGLDKYIDVIVANGETEKAKPDPQPVLAALKKIDATPKRSILVGDTLNDVICGNRADVITVRVAWSVSSDGHHDLKDPETEPDYIVNHLTDVLSIAGVTTI